MLADRITTQDLIKLLPAYGTWQPFPTINERAPWLNLPDDIRQWYLDYANANLGFDWPSLPATVFLDFKRNGNRSHYQGRRDIRRHMLLILVIAECIENEGRFLDDIVNGIWTTCEETYWGVPAHIHVQQAGVDLPDVEEPTVDLFASETVALLAWTVYLLGDKLDAISPLVSKRIAYESQRRMLDPCLDVVFPWMGLTPSDQIVNNWNPWINSNWLVSILLQEQDPERRVRAVHKALRSLDVFLNMYAEAGGCDEGPGYWGRAAASLFDCLEALYNATDGNINLYDEPKIRNMGRFIYRTHIHENYFVNFADASAVNHPEGSLIYRYGKRIADQAMMQFGAWVMAQSVGEYPGNGSSIGRLLAGLFEVPDPIDVDPRQPEPRDAWYDGIQVMVARSRNASSEGLFVAAKGGHNAESHNHNDIGNFIIYVDGLPVIVDAGVETYTRKTFSEQRYEIWTMQSSYHSLLPEIDGVQQMPGREFEAREVVYDVNDEEATLTLDLASAYPVDARLGSWRRVIRLRRGKAVEVLDSYSFKQVPSGVTFSLITPCAITLHHDQVAFASTEFGNGLLAGACQMDYDASKLSVHTEVISITDSRMRGVWGEHLNRVVFTCKEPDQQGVWCWRFTQERD